MVKIIDHVNDSPFANICFVQVFLSRDGFVSKYHAREIINKKLVCCSHQMLQMKKKHEITDFIR